MVIFPEKVLNNKGNIIFNVFLCSSYIQVEMSKEDFSVRKGKLRIETKGSVPTMKVLDFIVLILFLFRALKLRFSSKAKFGIFSTFNLNLLEIQLFPAEDCSLA